MTYHYTMCGLDYVYLLSGYRLHDTDYGEGASIEKADELDRSIAFAVVASQARLRGQEVRFLRALTHYSQAELASQLGVKRVTVARWEGAPTTPIPGPADRMIRLVAAKQVPLPGTQEVLMDLLPEITDGQAGNLFMTYAPEDVIAEPSLFPEDVSKHDGWHSSKVA